MDFNFIIRLKEALESYIGPSAVVGIDIGRANLKVAGVRLGTPPSMIFESVIDIQADRSDKAVADAIKKVLAGNPDPIKSAALIFSGETIAVRRIELPVMPQEEILEAVKWQIKDLLHYGIEEAVIDYELIGQSEKEDGSKTMELIAVAAQKKEIERNINTLKEAGLETVWVGAAPFAIENVIKLYDGSEAPSAFLVIDIGSSGSEISIFGDRRLEFVRSIQLGSAGISDSMVGTLAGENGTVSVTKEQAEKIKHLIGVPYEDSAAIPSDIGLTATQITSMMRPALESISTEISRSIGYYISEYSGKKVEAVYMAGAGSGMKNLERFMSEELSLPVRRISLPKAVARLKKQDPADEAAITAAAGAALGVRSRPNLLPYEYRVKRIEFMEKVILRTAILVLGTILALSFALEKKELDSYTQRLAHVQFQRDFLRQVKELHGTVGERYELLKLLQSSEAGSVGNAMNYLKTIIPPSISLKWLRVDLAAKTLDIGGVAYKRQKEPSAVITKFMEDIEKSKYFEEAQLTSSLDSVIDGRDVTEFEISCLFN